MNTDNQWCSRHPNAHPSLKGRIWILIERSVHRQAGKVLRNPEELSQTESNNVELCGEADVPRP